MTTTSRHVDDISTLGFHINEGREQRSVVNDTGVIISGDKDDLYKELWRACAGPLVHVPRTGESVVYFPQGHMEQVLFFLMCFFSFFPPVTSAFLLVLLLIFCLMHHPVFI